MIGIIGVHEPSGNASKGHKEAMIYVGYVLRYVAGGSFVCALLDVDDIVGDPSCLGCSRAQYTVTCMLDVFAAVAVACASYCMQNFGEKLPEKLAEQNLYALEFIMNTLKTTKVDLPKNVLPVVAVEVACCGKLIPFDEWEKHVPACEARSLIEKNQLILQKEALREKEHYDLNEIERD